MARNLGKYYFPKDLNNYYKGKGCKCHAYYYGECACGVDWTPKEVYELRKEVVELRKEVVELKKKANTSP